MHQQRSPANKESLKRTKPLQLTSDGLVTDDLAAPRHQHHQNIIVKYPVKLTKLAEHIDTMNLS